MITLLPLNRVIVGISVFYGMLVVVIVELVARFSDQHNFYSNVKIALSASTALNLTLLFAFHVGWKWLWSKFPVLNSVLFPNLAGKWKMVIHYVLDETPGEVVATATIRQDFVKISMEVDSPRSDSKTLIAQPKRDPESGSPLLYYVYHVEPKRVGDKPGDPYNGSATLRYSNEPVETLRGNYFTSQGTHGYFVLTRIGTS